MSAETVAKDFLVPTAQAPISLPLRNLGLTFALTALSLALAGALWGSSGYEMLIVAMGWPHIILGFLFYFGKVIKGELRARSYFLMLALLTLILWSAHYSYTITGFISIYFTYHVFRDEVFIYFQTRARHRLRSAVQVAGLVPFIFLMFIITDPRPQYYRQDLRRVELSEAQLAKSGWMSISFEPISYSRGREFYFYLQTSGVKGAQPYSLLATTNDAQADGEMRIADRKSMGTPDLLFEPVYADGGNAILTATPAPDGLMPVSLSGDYRVGQTFKAERDNLAGIRITTSAAADPAQLAHFTFHLTPDTSLPLPPLSPALNIVRLVIIVLLLSVVLWKALPQLKRHRSFWLYFLFLAAAFAVSQKLIRTGSNTGIDFPIMFQLIVVFHYWSWYVFSFERLRAMPPAEKAQPSGGSERPGLYERLLGYLRSLPHFTSLVVGLNLLSLAGVLWYSKLHGPAWLRYFFDYSYFLYFLVFHVTFSFAPRQSQTKISQGLQPAKTGAAA
jgi:hypothetical protein